MTNGRAQILQKRCALLDCFTKSILSASVASPAGIMGCSRGVHPSDLKAVERANMAVLEVKQIEAVLKVVFAYAYAISRREAVLYWN